MHQELRERFIAKLFFVPFKAAKEATIGTNEYKHNKLMVFINNV